MGTASHHDRSYPLLIARRQRWLQNIIQNLMHFHRQGRLSQQEFLELELPHALQRAFGIAITFGSGPQHQFPELIHLDTNVVQRVLMDSAPQTRDRLTDLLPSVSSDRPYQSRPRGKNDLLHSDSFRAKNDRLDHLDSRYKRAITQVEHFPRGRQLLVHEKSRAGLAASPRAA
jgi:hypothetical protein